MPARNLFGQPFTLPDAGSIFTPEEAEAEAVNAALEYTTGLEQERAEQQKRTGAHRLTLREFADLTPTPRRGRLDLERFPFQVEPLYSERAAEDREQVGMKATQVGYSEGAIRIAAFHADVRQRVVVYTFPTLTELRKFSAQRIGPMIRASEHLMSRMNRDSINNMEQRQIGPFGWVYFFGTDRPIDSVDADVVIFDEYDTSNQANIEASERRVTGPLSAGIVRRVGVPTAPGFGIAKLYERSDQRVWTVRCPSCEAWNPMRGLEAWEHNVDRGAGALVCRHCRRLLDVRVGEWVAKFPDRPVRGYHVPKLIVFGQSIPTLIANSEKKLDEEKQAFVTRDLGEPYAQASGRLSLEAIRACVREDLHLLEGRAPTSQLRAMGVDQASARALNVVIEEELADGQTTRVLWAGEVDDEPGGRTAFGMLCFLMDAFSVHMAGIDNLPDGRFAQAFVDRYPGRAFRFGYYHPKPSQRDPADWVVDDEARFAALHRTRTIDTVIERFRMQAVLIPDLEEMPRGETPYAEQLGNVQRRVEKSPEGREDVFYVNVGAADYLHAHVYALGARMMAWRAQGRAALLGAGPTPLRDTQPFQPSRLSDPAEASYRPGFEGSSDLPRSPFGPFFDGGGEGIE